MQFAMARWDRPADGGGDSRNDAATHGVNGPVKGSQAAQTREGNESNRAAPTENQMLMFRACPMLPLSDHEKPSPSRWRDPTAQLANRIPAKELAQLECNPPVRFGLPEWLVWDRISGTDHNSYPF